MKSNSNVTNGGGIQNITGAAHHTIIPTNNSKPEIISYNFGRHNQDLEKTASKIIQGGSWKKQRIIVLIPSSDMMSAKVALSHWNLIFPPNQAVFRMLMLGQEVGEAYSNAIEQILQTPELSDWEYILTIESDNIPPPDGVIKLLEDMEQHPEYSAFSGLYFCKGEGGCAHIWGDIKDPVVNYRPQIPRPNEIIEAYGLSMGFCLFRLSMFKDKKLRRPWFKTTAGIEGSGTQDLWGWHDFRKHGYRGAVSCDVSVGHLDINTGIVW